MNPVQVIQQEGKRSGILSNAWVKQIKPWPHFMSVEDDTEMLADLKPLDAQRR